MHTTDNTVIMVVAIDILFITLTIIEVNYLTKNEIILFYVLHILESKVSKCTVGFCHTMYFFFTLECATLTVKTIDYL